MSNRITVDIQWFPRKENREVDAISKMTNYDDWESTQVLFQYLDRGGGGGGGAESAPLKYFLHNSKTPRDIEKQLSDFNFYTFFTYFVNNNCSKILP